MTNLHKILSEKKKNKRVKFCPVILTNKKTNGNNEKGKLV